ncbi:MAG: hypothetical protein CMJ65_03885 [Planctomycetaceae bacterium]|jgi:hypothetical protein|nr:hypothetical protein [Planctomycetaceae bacterium]
MRLLTSLLLVLPIAAISVAGDRTGDDLRLSPRNTEVPFAFRREGRRSWPITLGQRRTGDTLQLALKRGKILSPSATRIAHAGLTATVTSDDRLEVSARPGAVSRVTLELSHTRDGQSTRQTITLQPAPPDRPISYVSDLVDDLIRIFWDYGKRAWRPITRDAFDQYFRRLQCHGVNRLIVWPGPLPTLVDPDNYPGPDWRQYVECARAIRESPGLTAGLARQSGLPSWSWLRMLMRLRMKPQIMQDYAASARAHRIQLSVSFRPFESGLTKYYVVPRFGHDGRWLGNFLPHASPATQFHPDEVGFAHYRLLLEKLGRADAARVETIELVGVADARQLAERFARGRSDLRLRAAPVAPIDDTSLVLVRQADASYQLRPYAEIRKVAEASWPVLADWKLEATSDTSLRLTGIRWPRGHRFLQIEANTALGSGIELAADGGLTLRAAAGNRLGRVNVYWVLDGSDPGSRKTRIAGIPLDGLYRTEFQAIEASHAELLKRKTSRIKLAGNTLVIDRGADWSVEMVDFQRPRARQEAIAEIATQLALPAYDEIYINTRSHTQLAASTGDGVLGLKSILEYRRAGKTYTHLGLDRTQAPIGLASFPPFADRLKREGAVEQITTWQSGEWSVPCPDDDTKLAWRFHRSRAVARGVRALLQDLQARFPKTRIRAVIPQRARVERAVKAGLATMKRPDQGVYKRDFYRHIWSSLNHIPAIGEGMAEIDLEGLRVEPVFLGIRYAPPPGPLALFLQHTLKDMTGNRGSSFSGPRGFCYEAQETLRAADRKQARQKRETIIRRLLAHGDDIREVILYESADWTYYLPITDPHGYLDPSSVK